MAPGIAEKKNNALPLWGNEKTMNLNNLILTNILSSHYFKVNLYQLKTYHEVIDEIYYQVTHLEPWEKGSRKTSGQTGMCGGVRGVGAGGIVSTAFCILYKLFTLKLTRKQVVGLINHADSPYIRALGFMYIRYTQPPVDLWDWYEGYLEDEEELDVKAGGGQMMSIGEMLRHFLSKLEWFSTLFPRIPVPIQKDLERKLSNWRATTKNKAEGVTQEQEWIDDLEQEQEMPHWNGDPENERSSSSSQNFRHKDPEKELREKSDLSDDISKEKERQKKEKERHGSSKLHHHTSDRHKDHVSYSSSKGRSRSPVNNVEPKSHRNKQIERHKEKYREKGRKTERSKHRCHHHHGKNNIEWEKEYKSSKAEIYHPEKKDLERRSSSSHNYDHADKHDKRFTRIRSRDRH